MSKRAAFTFLKLAIASTFVSAHYGARATSLADQDGGAIAVSGQADYPEGYRALRLAADAIEQEENAALALFSRTEEAAAIARPSGTPSPSVEMVRIAQPPQPFKLVTCSLDMHLLYLTTREPGEAVLEYTARRVAFFDGRLRAFGYPPAMIEGPIRNYERAMLALALEAPAQADRDALSWLRSRMSPLEERLVQDLETNRVAQGQNLPVLWHSEYACSLYSLATHARSYVRTIPAAGRVWVIPIFRFYVCRHTSNIPDPWSVEGCRWWREVHPDQASLLIGRHKYQARWPDGETRRGDRTFEHISGPYDEPVVVHVRRD